MRTTLATTLTTLLLMTATPAFPNPWGKDADLALPCCCDAVEEEETVCSPDPMSTAALLLIHFHQSVLTHADGPRSHYVPSSSEYTRQAICKYGFFQGFIMGCDRLSRENSDPWVYREVCNDQGYSLKWNPVP